MEKNQIENKTDFIMVMNDWTNHHQTREWIDYCVSIGYKYYEIQMLCLPEDYSEQDDVINYALSKGLKINLHSHYAKNNIIDTDEENRKKSILQLKQTIDLSARHNLGVVTFHPGRLSSEDENIEEKWKLLLETVGHIAEYAKQKKVHIAIENMERRKNELVYTIDDLNRFADFGKDNPYFGVTIDFAHFASHGIYSPELERLDIPIFNVHISQCTDEKMHLPLTIENGKADLVEACRVLKKYGYKSFVVLEIHEDFKESVDILSDAYNKSAREIASR